ncbi:MAG: xanthine dehydrogenase family protein molybdopterin-binding subunit [Candidatus Pacebacteria bacterium]|nr:xanthine dehydrogenase family protein molybdopterin-binding subunit [Candidatus Paceibacterota bacterium]
MNSITKFGIGQTMTRQEDIRLLQGQGRYSADLHWPHQAVAFVLRSPQSHAEITRLDTAAASKMPGVLLILTHREIDAEGLNGLPCWTKLPNRDGTLGYIPERPLLAKNRVRFVGEPVAFIVAESLNQARSAAEAIDVVYKSLPSATVTADALNQTTPQIWPDAPQNQAFDWQQGAEEATNRAFAAAKNHLTVTLVNNRVASSPMEPRAAIGKYEDGKFTLHSPTQGVHVIRDCLSRDIFKLPADDFIILSDDVGGGFGPKLFPGPEQALVLSAARRLGRPVKWVGERSDNFMGEVHGRDNVTTASIAFDDQARILALRVETIANMGAYLSPFGPMIATKAGTGMLTGLYDIPTAVVRVHGVFTNTVPVEAYRGAGRPEATFVIERLVDHLAYRTGLDRTEVRRRNLIRPEQLPYKTALGQHYDSGEFAAIMDAALARSDQAGFAARRVESLKRGRLRGLGLATYVEACAGNGAETAVIEMAADGSVTLLIGTQNNGQGHETAYAQILAETLGIDPQRVTLIQGDTRRVKTGNGTGGSRSVPIGGAALQIANQDFLAKSRVKAAEILGCAADDLRFEDSMLVKPDSNQKLSLVEVAAAANGLSGTGTFTPSQATYPNGCHVVELEIEVATGATTIDRYTVVDDFGRTINPALLAGQVYGGIAQGVGQALLEECRYDAKSGQLLTASFMDYAMPRGTLLPMIDFSLRNIPCQTNPLGIKGAGEAGAIGAPPTIISAIVDALQSLDGGAEIVHIDMPATSQKIWQMIQEIHAKRRAA